MILMMLSFLGLSWAAAWFFFGGIEEDPERKALAAYQNHIESLLPKAGRGDYQAQIEVARLYRDGKEHTQSYKDAVLWFRKAADRGHLEGLFELGQMYEKGLGVGQDYLHAITLYQKAAGLGRYSKAQFALGYLYFEGRGVNRDLGKAIDLFHITANKGHPVAQHLLGGMYLEGWGVDENPIEAYKWLSLAAQNIKQVRAFDPTFNPSDLLNKLRSKMNKVQLSEAKALLKDWKQQ